MRIATIILAAGQGTRMKSDLPKVLHTVGGKPMVARSVATAAALGTGTTADLPLVIVAPDADQVRAALHGSARFAVQDTPLGTGHAVMQAQSVLEGNADLIVVFYADMPLLRTETLDALIDSIRANQEAAVSLLTVLQDDPRGFGRIVRRPDGSVEKIVEEKQCTPEQRAIRELNVGVYVFRADFLWNALSQITAQPNGEYYLTDLVDIAVRQGRQVIPLTVEDRDQVIGVNTRVHLAEAETALRKRINHYWMTEGVTMRDPATVYIDESVQIGRDTVILTNTHVRGVSVIGAGCTIGPNTTIEDSTIGDQCTLTESVIERSTLEDHVQAGPYAHIRPNSYLERGVHMGNFGEVKASRLGAGTRMGHFSYIGDAEIGQDVNIGAGTITANFDGVRKHKTHIGDHVFIGSDTIIVAPRTIADDSRTAAGSVVTKDVPSGHIAIGLPARMRLIPPKAQPEPKDDNPTAL